MTTTTRQNNLVLAEDWKRIYQTFKNADFKSYDFENLRRVMITYLRENYPEDFNDYIESSEYVALIDLLAFLGQSLAFRIDLASRENFIELAERKESVLRLARTLAYNAKRNVAASGLLKFDTVSTTETLYDSNSRNLARQTVIWNDPTNTNWYEQFITVLNAAMTPNTRFGKDQGSATVGGIPTEQYRFNSSNTDVPMYTFSKVVAGRLTTFEVVSTSIENKKTIEEEVPLPGRQFGFVYREDGRGSGSNNTGFFMMFKQGSLEVADFSIDQPTVNETISVASENINNNDVWLWSLNGNGTENVLWSQVAALTGNNIVYNSVSNGLKNIYSVVTKENDKVDLVFSDGAFGNLPQGPFRVYYRVSNGLSYSIASGELKGISISIPYVNAAGANHTLTIVMSLNYSVDNSAASETIDSIRSKAPAVYYTQNRMITGEDYNLAPLSSSQDILKVKAINRSSSGISRNFDIIDASGKYSKVNTFSDDGLIYRSNSERSLSFVYTNKSTTLNFVRGIFRSTLLEKATYNFYLTNFDKIFATDVNVKWLASTTDATSTTGYFGNVFDSYPFKVGGSYTTSNLKYVEVGSMIKFVPPTTTQAFKNGKLVTYDPLDLTHKKYIWAKVVKVVGDGTNAGKGNLSSGYGPITLSETIPYNARPSQVLPKFVNTVTTDIETEILNLTYASENFGLRYDIATRTWKVISGSNLNQTAEFSLGQAGSLTNSGSDASWLVAFIYNGERYNVRFRGTDYVFSSVQQNRFYFDKSQKIYDSKTRQVIKDQIRVLGINSVPTGVNSSSTTLAEQIMTLSTTKPSFTTADVLAIIDQKETLKDDVPFEITDTVRYNDGYQSYDSIKIAFNDSDDDGVIDNPDSFDEVVGTEYSTKFLFFKETVDEFGAKTLTYVPNENGYILVASKEVSVNVNDYAHNQLIYFYDQTENYVKRVDLVTRSFILMPEYTAKVGRADLKFQYIHNANVDRRIDPSSSNIIDIYLLTRSYDTNYRNWLNGANIKKPEAPTTESLRVGFGSNLVPIKSISDEIVYHPVNYFPLFGDKADVQFRVIFKVVKNPTLTINDNTLKVRIVNSITEFFSIQNWDFGDRFYAGELISYIMTQNAPYISNMVMVPKQSSQAFGSLYEIQAKPDEIFVSAATVDDVEIQTNITAIDLNLITSQVVTTTSN